MLQRHLASADIHRGGADHSHQHAGREAHQRRCGERLHDVVEKPAHARAKNRFFPLFRVISLDHAHAAQRLREAPGDFRINLAALAEYRPDDGESPIQRQREATKGAHSNQSQRRADAKQQHQRNSCRDQSASEVHQPGAQQIANAFHVAHDARHQRSSLVRVVKRNREPGDMLLHLLPKLGNQALGGLRKQLRQRERSHALNQRGQQHRKNKRPQNRSVMLSDDIVDEEFRGIWQNKSSDLIDHHQHKAQSQQPSARTHQLPHFGPNGLQPLDLRGLRRFFRWRTQFSV